MTVMFGVYRLTRNGDRYVSRSATTNEKLALEIARDLSQGEFTRPDGSIGRTVGRCYPHIVKPIPPRDR